MNQNALAGESSLRHDVAGLLGRCFAVHLLAELKKPDEVLYEVFSDWPVRKMMEDLLGEVRKEFGIAADEELPPENIFEAWVERNGKFQYEDPGFISYNLFYIHRLIDLREGGAESQERMFAAMRKGFNSFDCEKRGFSVSFFLDSESNMRGVLRETVKRHFPGRALEADAMVLLGCDREFCQPDGIVGRARQNQRVRRPPCAGVRGLPVGGEGSAAGQAHGQGGNVFSVGEENVERVMRVVETRKRKFHCRA